MVRQGAQACDRLGNVAINGRVGLAHDRRPGVKATQNSEKKSIRKVEQTGGGGSMVSM